jgi:type II secretory pathway pseudopilin PulG
VFVARLTKIKNGFSLIELVIIIAIISMMTLVGLVSLQPGRVATQLETSAREVSAAVREAQNNALAGKNASAGSNCAQYNFTYTAGSANYSVGTVPAGSGCPLTVYSLKNGVTFASGGLISFSIPFGTVSPATMNQIRLVKGSSSYYVCVNQAGNISEQKSPCL